MTLEKVSEVVDLAKAVHEIEKETGVYRLGANSNGPLVQMGHDNFLETFPEYEITDRGSSDYPYQLETKVDGVWFIALLTQDEYDELVR